MKARLKTRTTIKATPAEVFKYLGHTKYHPLWNPQMQSVTPLEQLQKDAVYTVQSLVLGVRVKAENHVTSYEQDRELEVHNRTGMIQYGANFRLNAQAKGTQITCTIVVSSDSKAFAFAKPLMEHLARKELRADLAALKDAVEQKMQP
jgi:carbon monoxide dehydrogenase subunit G